jgi:integrase
MATLRNRSGKWQARVVRKGHAPLTKTFRAKQDAERWARQVESSMDKGIFSSPALAEKTTFKEVVERYIKEVTPTMRSVSEDTFRLRTLSKHPLCKLSMTALTPTRIAEYRDERLKTVTSGTVIRELSYLSSIINHARREWGINITNPVPLVKKPATPLGRNRLLSEAETMRLLEKLSPSARRSIWMLPIVQFALETAMRRGELLTLKWADIDLKKQTAFLKLTKNGESRTVPLSSDAVRILENLPRSIEGRVFPVNAPAVAAAFIKARKRAGIVDFRFHDLRHMAITRMAEKLPNLIELSAVSGHKSLAMLKRYYHPDAGVLAQKLG